MACCGPSIKRRDEKTLFDDLRANEEEILLSLNKINMQFLPDKGDWKSNLLLLLMN